MSVDCGSEGRGFESRRSLSHIVHKRRSVFHRVERRDVVTMVSGSLGSFTIVGGVAKVWREPEKDKGISQHLAQHPSTSGYLLEVDDVRG
jgi:hypothetical protein